MSVHGRAILGLPFLTGFFAGVAYPLGGFGLVYQSLPSFESELRPATGDLYQPLPPRIKNSQLTHIYMTQWLGGSGGPEL